MKRTEIILDILREKGAGPCGAILYQDLLEALAAKGHDWGICTLTPCLIKLMAAGRVVWLRFPWNIFDSLIALGEYQAPEEETCNQP